MKKVLLVLLCVFAMAMLASAQNYVPDTDVLGAHNNGGRGCAGCHQPHSGAGGAGGNAIANQTSDTTNSGDDALFGQDLGPLYNKTFNFGDKGEFAVVLPAFSAGSEEIRGIAMCLACHDGSVAKGAMMDGNAYEQRMGLLPSNYGTGKIPTLLGNDGRGTGYYNDHPVGAEASLGAAHLDQTLLTVTITSGAISGITPNGAYSDFVANYGYPAIAGTPWAWGVGVDAATLAKVGTPKDPTKPWLGNYTNNDAAIVLCTTCHNQHSMNVYKSLSNKGGIAGDGGNKTYRTYFFVNAPYNVGATAGLQSTGFNNVASSATQFCRQCHFSTSNEAYGQKNITTKFQ